MRGVESVLPACKAAVAPLHLERPPAWPVTRGSDLGEGHIWEEALVLIEHDCVFC